MGKDRNRAHQPVYPDQADGGINQTDSISGEIDNPQQAIDGIFKPFHRAFQ